MKVDFLNEYLFHEKDLKSLEYLFHEKDLKSLLS